MSKNNEFGLDEIQKKEIERLRAVIFDLESELAGRRTISDAVALELSLAIMRGNMPQLADMIEVMRTTHAG